MARQRKRAKALRVTKSTKKAVKAKEMTILGQALRSLGGLGGSTLGSFVGMPATGANMGTNLGASVSKWLGSGDYTVGANSIVTNVARGSSAIPMMHRDGQSVIVRHKEYVSEISGSTSFTIQKSLPLNPGISITFPWLSTIASSFQEYRMRGVVFHYVPSSGSATGSNTALGTVMLQTTYRSSDVAPVSKAELLNEYCASESVPSEAFAHPIECDPKENPFNVQYIRGQNVPAGDNQMLYDLGTTHVATSGQQGSNVIGDLWVTYEIELKKPLLFSNVTSQRLAGTYSLQNATVTTSSIFPTGGTFLGNYTFSLSANTLTLPAGSIGTFWITVIFPGNYSAYDMGPNPTLVNCTNFPISTFFSSGYRSILVGTSLTNPTATVQVMVTNHSSPATLTWAPTVLTGGSSLVVVVTNGI